jgi:hypothetical protein
LGADGGNGEKTNNNIAFHLEPLLLGAEVVQLLFDGGQVALDVLTVASVAVCQVIQQRRERRAAARKPASM